MFDIKLQHLTVAEIYNYLSENDQIFNPALSLRLDIRKFAIKLNEFAVHFCAYKLNELVGFSGCYFNNVETLVGFISTFSVITKFQGMGVAKGLLNSIKEYGANNEYKQINLQVYISNFSAIRLYSEAGFIEISRCNNIAEMSLILKHSRK